MDRIKALLGQRKAGEEEYAPLADDERLTDVDFGDQNDEAEPPFSWIEYSIFALIGVAMLWAWNMFLAAAPYFQKRFQDNDWILQNFQSAILSVSTITNLTALIVLTNIQKSASYPFRISTALIINIGAFTLLTVSTSYFLSASAWAYFVFVLLMVGGSSCATGLIQNGAFAFAASFGRPEYTQALMAGQGIAGVLPAVAQMISVLAVPPPDEQSRQVPSPLPADGSGAEVPTPPPPAHEGARSAFLYFLTAVVISVAAFAAFIPLLRRYRSRVESRMAARLAHSTASIEEAEQAGRTVISIPSLLRKLQWPAAAVFTCFAVTMFFPVLTVKIPSVRPPVDAAPIFQPAAFIPLAFFFWNLGDLLGRVATILPFSLRGRPVVLFALAVARTIFLPLYLLCNVGGRGAFVNSDVFYLLGVQLPFGLTNGWVGASSMMAAGEWVDEGEREVAGGFMGLCLVAGLAVGSLMSFTAAGL